MFEKLGRFFAFSRKKYLLIIFLLMSFAGSQFYIYGKKQEIEELRYEIEKSISLTKKTEAFRNRFRKKWSALQQSQKNQLILLEEDFMKGQKLAPLKPFSENHPLYYKKCPTTSEKKPYFSNFVKTKQSQNSYFTETLYEQSSSYQIDKKGLESLLALLEKNRIGKNAYQENTPDYLITNFVLEKNHQAFVLKMQLLERSVLHEN